MTRVNIVISDRGWILERLASEITSRLDYAMYGDNPDPLADINYYITYSCWNGRASPIEIAWFAHLEPLGEAREKFFNTARAMDYCLTQAFLYEDILKNYGIANVKTISPGVDLDRFTPKLKIGVVGRAYHTGRKGEHIVAQLMSMPEVEWHFTGSGWPGPALNLADDDLPRFYRQMDYILVPSLYEGGPMSVVEALASGTEVISSPVGWVPELPHIPFEIGNVDGLRAVLKDLYAKKMKLRESVLSRTWDAWAERHHELFQHLAHTLGEPAERRTVSLPGPVARPLGRIGLLMHGNEASSQGGPSVRVPRTARELNSRGSRADAVHFTDHDLTKYDVVHVFNVWSPHTALKALRQAKRQGKTTVFSPIFLDLSERPLWEGALLDVFRGETQTDRIDQRLSSLMQRWASIRLHPELWEEPMPGYFAMVREMIGLSDHVILLSERERELLDAIGARPARASIVHNPTDTASFKAGDPHLFQDTYGISDFVLCVGRIEPRKNQLMLAHALRDTGIPLVLIGHAGNMEYRDLIERHGGENVHFLGRLQPASDLLLSAFRAARVATLPSWSEGAPLAALEAGAAGTALVLSDRSSEPEYYGSHAHYVNPGDAGAIRDAILETFERRRTEADRAAQIDYVETHFSWSRYTEGTRNVYYEAMADRERLADTVEIGLGVVLQPGAGPRCYVFDVTTSVNRRGRWTGIARVEMSLALALADRLGDAIRFTHWDNKNRRFIEVPIQAVRDGELESFRDSEENAITDPITVDAGSTFVVVGSGWMQNAIYAEAVAAYAEIWQAELAVVIHDLIPAVFPYWFQDDYVPVFEKNMRIVLSNASRIIAISETTKRDVEVILRRDLDLDLPIFTFREGDQISDVEALGLSSEDLLPASLARLRGTDFVLSVGAIHARKNHKLLFDIWIRMLEQTGGRCPTLVIVGGVAWNGNDLARAIKNDRRIKGKIVLLDNVDDAGLDWLYRHCIFTAYPSLYEGWGLPVCESLRYGKICLASNASSIQEIAPEATDLLDPLDFAAWYTRVRFYANSAIARHDREAEIREKYQPTSWSEAADGVLRALHEPIPPTTQKARYHLGAVTPLTSAHNPRRFLRGPWHFAESWGVWSAGTEIGFDVDLPTPPARDVTLGVKAKALLPAGGRLDVQVFVGEEALTTWSFFNGTPQIRTVVIPHERLAEGTLRIRLVNSALFKVSECVATANDPRSVGIGLFSFSLQESSRVATLRARLDPKSECEEALKPGVHFNLLESRIANRLVTGPWEKTSPWGMWPMADDAALNVICDSPAGEDLQLELGVRAVATPEAPLAAAVLANDTVVAEWSFDSSDFCTQPVIVPVAVRRQREPVALVIRPAETRSPKSLAVGAEERSLGLGLFDIGLAESKLAPIEALATVKIGNSVNFARSDSADQNRVATAFLRRGWYGLERSGVWSLGRQAEIAFKLDRHHTAGIEVRLALKAFDDRSKSPKTLIIRANGHPVGEASLTPGRTETVTVTVPGDLLDDGTWVRLGLEVSHAGVPSLLSTAKDDRLLGVLLSEMVIDSALVVQPFTSYECGSAGDIDEVFRGGWHRTEANGRWGDAGPSTIRFAVNAIGHEQLLVRFSARTSIAVLAGERTIAVEADGERRAVLEFAGEEIASFDVVIPVTRVDGRAFLDFAFVTEPGESDAQADAVEAQPIIWLSSFEVLTEDAPCLKRGDQLDLVNVAEAERVLVGPWKRSGAWGFRCIDQSCALSFVVDPQLQPGQQIQFTARSPATAEQPRIIQVRIGGVDAATWHFTDSRLHVLDVPLPSSVRGGQRIDITFQPDEEAPSSSTAPSGLTRLPFAFGLFEVGLRGTADGHRVYHRASNLPLSGEVLFGTGGATADGLCPADFLGQGWHRPEEAGVWSRGSTCDIVFSVPRSVRVPLQMSMQARPYSRPGETNRLTGTLNGQEVFAEEFESSMAKDISFELPRNAVRHGAPNVLTLDTAISGIASVIGAETDDRYLGVLLQSVTLHPAPALRLGEACTMESSPSLRDVVGEGWYQPEVTGIWSGPKAQLRIKVECAASCSVALLVSGRVYGTRIQSPVEIEIWRNDSLIQILSYFDDAVQEKDFEILIENSSQPSTIELILCRKGIISPADLGEKDDRALGLFLSQLQVISK